MKKSNNLSPSALPIQQGDPQSFLNASHEVRLLSDINKSDGYYSTDVSKLASNHLPSYLGKEPFDIGSLPPSTLLDDKTASHYLGVTPGTLSVWRSTGRYALPFVKCGSKVRYRAADLLAFVEGRVHTHT